MRATFKYLIPTTAGNKLRISRNSSQVSSLFQSTGIKFGAEYRGTYFTYKPKPGDTICASRSGIVFECIDKVKRQKKRKMFLFAAETGFRLNTEMAHLQLMRSFRLSNYW